MPRPSPFSFVTPQSEPSAWDQCFSDFLRSLDDRGSKETSKTHRHHLHKFFSQSFNGGPPKHPEDYTHQDIEYFLHLPSAAHRTRGQPVSSSARNQRLAALTRFYRYASLYTIPGPDGSPVPLFSKPSPTLGFSYVQVPRKARALTDDEITRLFAAIPTDSVKGCRDLAIFLTYLLTMRRREEIARLRWGDIWRGQVVDDGETQREAWLYRYRGKGRNGQEYIAEFPQLAKEAIDLYLVRSGRMATMRPESPVFTSVQRQAGTTIEPLNGRTIARHLKAYARKAGIQTPISLHMLRHTGAVQRIRSKANTIFELKDLLGHRSLDTTYGYILALVGTADPGVKVVEARYVHLLKK